jgi:hypothetical protein
MIEKEARRETKVSRPCFFSIHLFHFLPPSRARKNRAPYGHANGERKKSKAKAVKGQPGGFALVAVIRYSCLPLLGMVLFLPLRCQNGRITSRLFYFFLRLA